MYIVASMTLHDMIRQELQHGQTDPHVIAERLLRRDPENVLAALVEIAQHVIADEARYLIRSDRRAAMGATRVEKSGVPLVETVAWLPGVGWRKLGTLTANECREVADAYRTIADRNITYAGLYDGYAARIEAAGVETLAELIASEQAAA